MSYPYPVTPENPPRRGDIIVRGPARHVCVSDYSEFTGCVEILTTRGVTRIGGALFFGGECPSRWSADGETPDTYEPFLVVGREET